MFLQLCSRRSASRPRRPLVTKAVSISTYMLVGEVGTLTAVRLVLAFARNGVPLCFSVFPLVYMAVCGPPEGLFWVPVYTLSDASAAVTHDKEATYKHCFFIYSVFRHAVLAFHF